MREIPITEAGAGSSKTLRLAGGVLFSAVSVYGILYFAEGTPQLTEKLEYRWLALALGLYIPDLAIRVLRVLPLIENTGGATISKRNLCGSLAVQQGASQLLPFRLGDLTFAFLLHRQASFPVSAGIALTVLSRLADFAALGITVFCASFLVEAPDGFLAFLRLSCVAATGLAAGPLFGGNYLVSWLQQKLPKSQGISRTAIKWRTIEGNIALTNRSTWLLILWSTVLWIFSGLRFWAVWNSVGAPLTPAQSLITIAASIVSGLAPLAAPASLGTFELGAVSILHVWGYEAATAAALALRSHLILLALSTLTAIAVGIVLKRQPPLLKRPANV